MYIFAMLFFYVLFGIGFYRMDKTITGKSSAFMDIAFWPAGLITFAVTGFEEEDTKQDFGGDL